MARNPLYPDALQPMEMQGNDLIGYKPTLADGWDYNAKAYNDWVAQQQADLVARGLNDPQTGWPTQAGWVDAAHQIGNSLLMGTTAPGIRAFHGSPHSFDKFSLENMGAGAGDQAYGHGLYLTENERIAQKYKQVGHFPPDDVAINGAPLSQTAEFASLPTIARAKVSSAIASGPTKADWHAHFEQNFPSGYDESKQKALDFLKGVDENSITATPPVGNMYEVNLNANPEHMLDWDKPLSEQHPVVQDALNKLGVLSEMSASSPTGRHAWWGMHGLSGNDSAAASQALQQAGIPGIRYLDGQSRNAGEGSRNYVVFNPENIAILRKYGLAGLMAGGTAAAASDQ